MEQSDSQPARHWIVTVGSWVTGVGLLLLSVQCFVYPDAAKGYGVFPLDDNGYAYLLATGMRDFALGCVTLYLLTHFRASLGPYMLILTIVPVSDTLIVLKYGESSIGLIPHIVGIIGLLVVSILAFREQAQT